MLSPFGINFIANLAAIPFTEMVHNHNMARYVDKTIITPPPISNDPRKYVENTFGFDMTASMVRDQRMSGIMAANWGNTSGMI